MQLFNLLLLAFRVLVADNNNVKFFSIVRPCLRNKKSKFRLTPGLKLFLYESAFRKALVASATIKTIEFVNIEEIMDTYNDKLMISKNELVKEKLPRPKPSEDLSEPIKNK